MNARKLILTAGSVIAVAAPLAQPAGAAIPWDGGSRPVSVALHEVRASLHSKSTATTIHVGAYNVWAYAPGGVSPKVAKAITTAGKKRPKTPPTVQTKVPGTVPGTMPIPAPGQQAPPSTGSAPLHDAYSCQLSGVCTDEELCTIWGLGCVLVEQQQQAAQAPDMQASTDGA